MDRGIRIVGGGETSNGEQITLRGLTILYFTNFPDNYEVIDLWKSILAMGKVLGGSHRTKERWRTRVDWKDN